MSPQEQAELAHLLENERRQLIHQHYTACVVVLRSAMTTCMVGDKLEREIAKAFAGALREVQAVQVLCRWPR